MDKCEKIIIRVLHHMQLSLRKRLFLMGIHLIELLREGFLEPSRVLSYRRGFKQPMRKFKQPSNMSKQPKGVESSYGKTRQSDRGNQSAIRGNKQSARCIKPMSSPPSSFFINKMNLMNTCLFLLQLCKLFQKSVE